MSYIRDVGQMWEREMEYRKTALLRLQDNIKPTRSPYMMALEWLYKETQKAILGINPFISNDRSEMFQYLEVLPPTKEEFQARANRIFKK